MNLLSSREGRPRTIKQQVTIKCDWVPAVIREVQDTKHTVYLMQQSPGEGGALKDWEGRSQRLWGAAECWGDSVLDREENVHNGQKSRAWHQTHWKEFSTAGDKGRQTGEEPKKLRRKRSWPLKQGCSDLRLRKVTGGAEEISWGARLDAQQPARMQLQSRRWHEDTGMRGVSYHRWSLSHRRPRETSSKTCETGYLREQ